MSNSWKVNSRDFFNLRANEIVKNDYRAMCHVSGRNYQIWSDERLYNDLISSILIQLDLTDSSRLLEVGCATGFLAQGLAPSLLSYTGVDVAPKAVKAAKTLKIPNASFLVGDGESLKFADNTFDCAICYDVFTNFPDFKIGEDIIKEMLRVIKPNGRVMVGSVPDSELQHEYMEKVAEVTNFYSNKPHHSGPKVRNGIIDKLLDKLFPPIISNDPSIICYYFPKKAFIDLGKALNTKTQILSIHSQNPYFGYRYNVVYTK